MTPTRFIVAAFLSALAWTSASPVHEGRSSLDVWVPPILTPTTHTVWHLGDVVKVTWDPSNPPKLISNKASVVLQNRRLGIYETLSSGFSLLDGSTEVTVPITVPFAKDYNVILFGDSGNSSPLFSILPWLV